MARTSDGHGGDAALPALMIAAVDTHHRITALSTQVRSILGYTPQEMVGQPAEKLFTAAVTEAFGPSGDVWQKQLVLRHRSGSPVLAAVQVAPAPDVRHERAWLITALPLEQFVTEQALAQCDLPVAVIDTRLHVVRASRGLAVATGLEQDTLRGRDLHDLTIDPEGAESIEDRARRVASTGEPESFDVRFTRGAGPQRIWSATITALRDTAGQVRHTQLIALDATEEYRARRRLAVLNEVSTRVGTTLDLEHTAQEMAEVVVEHLADFVSVDLLDYLFDGKASPGGDAVVLLRAAHASVLPGVPEATVAAGQVDSYPSASPPARALATGQPSLHRVLDTPIKTWAANDAARGEAVRRFGIHSIMVLPLRARGTTLGVSVMVRHQRDEPFAHDDLLLAEEIAARAAVSIDNARRYRDARGMALTLQQSLLPQPPAHQQAVEIAFRYKPAEGRAGVGGDWFDAIPLPGARLALVVGDVVGHGLHSSVTMGRLRTAVRTLADVDLPPDELLTHLDDLVTRLGAAGDPTIEPHDGTVATCLYAIYDATSGCLALASAGHPLPLIAAPEGGQVREAELAVGPPLGVGAMPFEMREEHLTEGSLIALFTDGLIRAPRTGTDGTRQLREVLSHPVDSLDTACDRVMLSQPDAPDDDIALLLARTRTLPAGNLATLQVQPDPAAVAGGREWARERLEEWQLFDAVFVTELIVSELLTNAIRHAAAPIRLRLIRTTSLLCEVWDASSTTPHLRRAHSFDEGGRGLMLVAQLCDHWGTRHIPSGKIIWAEIATIRQP
jgi:PAS domain S-box-containing protein